MELLNHSKCGQMPEHYRNNLQEVDYTFRIIIVGECKIGKTTILNRLFFNNNY